MFPQTMQHNTHLQGIYISLGITSNWEVIEDRKGGTRAIYKSYAPFHGALALMDPVLLLYR